MNTFKTVLDYFLDGFGSIFNDIFPTILDDEDNIRQDWENVGSYIRSFLEHIEETEQE